MCVYLTLSIKNQITQGMLYEMHNYVSCDYYDSMIRSFDCLRVRTKTAMTCQIEVPRAHSHRYITREISILLLKETTFF
ncbi:hypothetical protein V1477_001187 [Vespula maculifrons]|uniref:Uncharacterized protein n=1 Tax=Vespula maculifrons TaxID=7453 RepID=A0ABD2CZV6_VESMC